MTKFISAFILTFIFLSPYSRAHIVPPNNLAISVNDKSTNNMTKERFEDLIKRVFDIYKPVVKSKGGNLTISSYWDSPTVNASALRIGGKAWVVSLYGGLARHPKITDDAFTLVICHELAHHIGGAPRIGSFNWASNEGQADYFASMKCMRRIFENDDNISLVNNINVDHVVFNKCNDQYKNENESALCKRIAMAGFSLAEFMKELEGSAGVVSFSTPDKNIVSKTIHTHPSAQCRLDTFFQGILCDKSYDQDVDKRDPIIGNCHERDNYKSGTRPRCWFH